MAEPVLETAPSLGRDALAGRLEHALAALAGEEGPSAAWRRAWLLTAVGRYGEALQSCEEALEGPPVLQSSARMAQAMLYRQVALHDRAEVADTEALDLLQSSPVRSPSVRAAIRVGLVADAVGLGLEDATISRRLQVAAAAVTAAGSWRQSVRLTWVRGEVLMLRGRYGPAAKAFGGGARIAGDQGAKRHEAKSLIFLAAACAARQERSEAARFAQRGLQLAARCAAAPLMWPAELILAEVADDGEAEAHLERARSVAGGLLRSLPEDLQQEALRRPPASWLLADTARPEPAPKDPGPLPTDA